MAEWHRSMTVSIGQLLSGKYRLDHFIGEGGVGVVYRAFAVDLHREVAVKVLKPQADPERFRQVFVRLWFLD